MKLRLQAGAHTGTEVVRKVQEKWLKRDAKRVTERKRERERKRYAHRHTKVRPGALHTLWHTFQRKADDIGMPYGLAFGEHGYNKARILLAQSV